MKTFRQMMNEAKKISSFKVKSHKVVVTQNGKKFDVTVDGEKLDTFESQKEAEQGAKDFIGMMTK
mgnify:CR=1 FL=1